MKLLRLKQFYLCLGIFFLPYLNSCKSTESSFLRKSSSKSSSYLVSSLDERSEASRELQESNIATLKEDLNQAISKDKTDIVSRLSLAKLHFLDKNYDESRFQCQQVLIQDSKNIEAKKILASIYYATGNYDMVSIIINGMDANSREDSALLNLEALVALQEGDNHLATVKFHQSLRIDPNNVATRMNLGTLYIKYKLFKQAGIQFDRVLSLMPENKDAALHQAIVDANLENADISSVYKTYKSILKTNPQNSIAWFNLASLQTKDKKYDDAQLSLDKYLDTAYVKSHKENKAFDLLAKIQQLKTQDEDNLKLVKKSLNSDSTKQNIVNEGSDSLEELPGGLDQDQDQ